MIHFYEFCITHEKPNTKHVSINLILTINFHKINKFIKQGSQLLIETQKKIQKTIKKIK